MPSNTVRKTSMLHHKVPTIFLTSMQTTCTNVHKQEHNLFCCTKSIHVQITIHACKERNHKDTTTDELQRKMPPNYTNHIWFLLQLFSLAVTCRPMRTNSFLLNGIPAHFTYISSHNRINLY